MKHRIVFGCSAAVAFTALYCLGKASDGQIFLASDGTNTFLQVRGNTHDEWRFQASEDLVTWTNAATMGSVFSGIANLQSTGMNMADAGCRFVRAVTTDGLFDINLLRTISLTFTNSNWKTLLADARGTNGNVPCTLVLDNGVTVSNVGARYRGNTSYDTGGIKKSMNLDINYSDSEARVMGYRTVNLNNAAGDNTIMREPVYFNAMREYAPCPQCTTAKLTINGEYWGVYSMVEQINNDLVDEWFPSHKGDRWRAPNMGGGLNGGGFPTNGIPTNGIPGGGFPTNGIPTNGIPGGGFPGGGFPTNGIPTNSIPTNGIPGGGFGGGGSAFDYLGALVSSYTNSYELKSDNSTNAWERLVHAIDVLNNTPADQLRDKVEEVFAVDSWLWFLAVENIFVDDDSYWNKGADYAFYYEPESGRIHPIEHDGNEAFASAMGATSTLSPVEGAASTNRPMLSKLLSVPDLRQRYLAHLRTALEQRFNPTCLTPVINHYYWLTVADLITDTKKDFAMTTYTNDLVALKTYVTNRYSFLTNHEELRPLPPKIVAVHDPSPQPEPAEMPFITAQVEANGSEGIDSVWLYWRDKSYGRFSVTRMFDDGAHNDGAANDGLFGGATTNYPAGNKIHYYVEARSANSAKAAAFSPARAEQNTHSYRVALTTATNTPVVINELMADNEKTMADPQGEYDDWIELRNLTDQEVDLTGHYLTDNPTEPRKWPFPAGTKISAGGYLLVWADENGSDTPGLHANFKLDKSGEQVLLIDTDLKLNAVLDSVTFTAQETDRSFGRSSGDADKFVVMQPTPGKPNSAY